MRQLSSKHLKIANLALPLMLTACQMMGISTGPQVTERPSPAPIPVVTETEREIRRLLREAAAAFEDNRLTTPVDDNAWYRYLRVLSLDPDNERAEEGIANIVEKYLEWAIDKARQDHFRNARNYLNKAKSVDETHPSIAAVENLIGELRSANRMTYRLAPAALERREPRIVRELQEIAGEISRHEATVVITGRTDEEGRWIYQQLNAATPLRVRARFEQGAHPSVRLIY